MKVKQEAIMWSVLIIDILIIIAVIAAIGIKSMGWFMAGFLIAAIIYPFIGIKVLGFSMGYMEDRILPRFPVWKAIGIVSIPLLFLLPIKWIGYPLIMGVWACIAVQTALFISGQDILCHIAGHKNAIDRLISKNIGRKK